MTDVLAGIVARKRSEVADRLRGRSFEVRPSTRSLYDTLARDGARFIMEVKRASPSGHRSSLPVIDAVKAYAPVADAISVLTDGPAFAGSLADLSKTRELFDGPILAKDFIVDPAQVLEARAAGADAVLAMMSVLTDGEARTVMTEAERLNMDVIVEVHDEKELERSLSLRPKIIGVNNRDLKTLATDLSVTERLAPLIPAGVLAIAESGIAARRDVDRLAPLVDAFLVGSALMAAPDTGQAARALVHGNVKICGLTCVEDVKLAGAAGATHAGFILAPFSSRTVTAQRAKALAEVARSAEMKPVGVFRDAPVNEVIRVAAKAGLAAVQLHGAETEQEIATVRAELPEDVEVWATCPVNGHAPAARRGADRSLFDTARDGRAGGTGETFNWSLVRERNDLPSAFLAGGIGPDNARTAQAVGAFGLDLCSRVECAPGLKDPDKVAALFAELRAPSRSGSC
ncbi:bifunctional indole-3-glycerol-phosphate synthase TrpC/phosphoribosylanthranilate isomerase TrpF [Sphingomonas alba]|uniref:N-(5'-phosphoribosyl)anthranilate isomerase n=1 Tax=Sphingomonas alba TaxID=2908208 RepID=A0ABT0RLX1_9SPHN|nr:bifunctional indole-3-glycerol-phosphate synthase TrpC/phosphoribosylanthranilate isomerase TrpF [Sphingomonas alba]MCL6683563.1 bifunctional indole-3-glycerol-phosphate synthase TrpC/phosphoribosylanthranilate isomerase TrpF [Sphingomonas alba]